MTLRIYGAGMAGLVTAAMLRRLRPIVYEAQAVLPDNHGALLRFRSPAVERETGIPFRRVRVAKAVMVNGRLRERSTLRDANLYNFKVSGSVLGDRSIIDTSPVERFIAPLNFLDALARDAILRMNSPLTAEILAAHKEDPEAVGISTIPMPALMAMVGWPRQPTFEFREVWSVTMTIAEPKVDVYQTIYYPDLTVPFYRASFTGSRLIVEFATDPTERDWPTETRGAAEDFGIIPTTSQFDPPRYHRYGKLVPLPDRERHEFIMAMTDEYNIYSVGRFATWRQILLDDVVADVRHVEAMITQRSAYHRRLRLSETLSNA